MYDPLLQTAIHSLRKHFSIQKVFLFGSRVQTHARNDSDYDLVLVVKDSDQDAFERRVKARSLLKEIGIPFDIFVYTTEEFEKQKNDFGSIVETAVNTGREIDL